MSQYADDRIIVIVIVIFIIFIQTEIPTLTVVHFFSPTVDRQVSRRRQLSEVIAHNTDPHSTPASPGIRFGCLEKKIIGGSTRRTISITHITRIIGVVLVLWVCCTSHRE